MESFKCQGVNMSNYQYIITTHRYTFDHFDNLHSRRVNLAGLLGLERFDPDNLQFVELSNGLPMIAPRRRDPQAVQNAAPNRFGGLLGIPQMVAAGLLPTARVMAQDVENSLGLRPGSVIRINNTVTLPLAFSRDASSAMPGRRPGSTPLTSRTSALRTGMIYTFN